MSKKRSNNGGIVYSTDPAFRVEEDSTPTGTPPPEKQRLRIKLDTRQRAGKAVTLVEGFTGQTNDLEELGRQLKTCCGTGGSVKDGTVIIQGDQRDKVLQCLLSRGYSSTKRS